MTSLLKVYLNPLIFTLCTGAYYTPWLVDYERGTAPGVLQGLTILAWFVDFICVAWIVALIQIVYAVLHLRRRNRRWRHHAASAGWAAACYCLWFYLASEGYLLTA